MDTSLIFILIYGGAGLLLLLFVLLSRRANRHGGSMRAGVIGAIYEMHNKDQQRALDIMVEEKRAKPKKEIPDGNLPKLENPTKD